MLNTILEQIKTGIPNDIQKIIKTKAWRDKQSDDVFLDPKGKTFPIKFEGEIRCDMINAALIFSSMLSKKGSKDKPPAFYVGIHKKAKALSISQGCTAKVKVNEDESVSVAELFEVYTLTAIHEIEELISEDAD
jgi:hypothetical protein